MRTVKDIRDHIEYRGRDWDSIVRRVWGRNAILRVGPRHLEGSYQGTVVKANPERIGGGYRVVAQVILYEE